MYLRGLLLQIWPVYRIKFVIVRAEVSYRLCSLPSSKVEAFTGLWRLSVYSPLINAFSFCRSEEFVRQMEAFALRDRTKFLLKGGKGAPHPLNWKLYSPLGTFHEMQEMYLHSEYFTSGIAKRRTLSFATRWSASWTFILRGFQSAIVF